jgi:hypothetical protein
MSCCVTKVKTLVAKTDVDAVEANGLGKAVANKLDRGLLPRSWPGQRIKHRRPSKFWRCITACPETGGVASVTTATPQAGPLVIDLPLNCNITYWSRGPFLHRVEMPCVLFHTTRASKYSYTYCEAGLQTLTVSLSPIQAHR